MEQSVAAEMLPGAKKGIDDSGPLLKRAVLQLHPTNFQVIALMPRNFLVACLYVCALCALSLFAEIPAFAQYDLFAASPGDPGRTSNPTLNMGGNTSNPTSKNNWPLQEIARYNLLAPNSVNMAPYPSGRFTYGFPNAPATVFMGVDHGNVGGVLPPTSTSSVDINIVSGPTVLTGGVAAMGGPPGGVAGNGFGGGAGPADPASPMANFLNSPDTANAANAAQNNASADAYMSQINNQFSNDAREINMYNMMNPLSGMGVPTILTPTQATAAVNTINAELATGMPLTDPAPVPMTLQSNLPMDTGF